MVDLIHGPAEVQMAERIHNSGMRLDRVEHFALVRQTDSAQFVTGKIHQPDLLEHAGFDNPVDPGCIVRQMCMCINEFHRMLRQILNFGAVAVLTSVTISRFL